MPRGGRLIILAIAGLILAGNAQPVSDYARGGPRAEQRNQKPSDHSNIAASVSRISNALEAQNARTDPYEKERNEREIRDLQAQEDSAYWAGAMFWATATALIFSVIGIALVWTTFRETRRANILSKAQQRARIEIKLEAGELNQGYLILALRGENIGGSAALDVGVHVQMAETAINPFGLLADPSHKHIAKPGDTIAFTVMVAPALYPQPFFVGGRATYRCIFGDDHESWFCFHVLPRDSASPLSSYFTSSSPLARIAPAKGIEWPDDT